MGRVLIGILVAAVLVALLFTVVFPWFDRQFVTDPVLGWGGAGIMAEVFGAAGILAS